MTDKGIVDIEVVNMVDRRKCRYCPERIKNLVGENCQGMTLRNKSGKGKMLVYLCCKKQEDK
jgi:hypothetical protein